MSVDKKGDLRIIGWSIDVKWSNGKEDSQPPSFWKWTSGVHKDKKPIGRECPAYKQGGECGSCRACWNRNIKQVSYKEH